MGRSLWCIPLTRKRGGVDRVDGEGFALPAEAIARLGSARLRHHGAVRGLAYAPDGKQIISLAEDDTIRLWDAGAGKLLRTTEVKFNWHNLQALRMGARTVDALNYGKIYSFDPLTGKELRRILLSDVPNPHRGCFSADGTLLAFGFAGSAIVSLRDPATGKEKNKFEPGPESLDITFTPDGKLLAIVRHGSNAIGFFDVATGKREFELASPRPNPHKLNVSPDGTRLLTSSYNGPHYTLWDLKAHKLLCELQGEGRNWNAQAVAFSPDSQRVAIGGPWSAVAVFDTTTGKELRRFDTGPNCLAMAFSSDGKRLVAGTAAGEISQWDAENGMPLTSADPIGGIRVRRFIDGDKHLLSETDRLVLFDWKAGKLVRQYPWAGEDYILPLVQLSPDGKLLAAPVATPERSGTIALIDAQTGKEMRRLRTLAAYHRYAVRLLWSPDSK